MRRVAIAAFGALLLGAAPAHAETFNVNTTDDVAQQCSPFTPVCSLRGALSAALSNGTADDDVINVPAGTYIQPEMPLGALARRITLIGAGANLTFIQPSGATRVFTLTDASMTLRGITVRGGRPTAGTGGNISLNASILTLEGVRVTDGRAPGGGGGISAISGGTASALTITRSLIDANAATGTSNGGGIALFESTTAASLTVSDSTIAYNTAPAAGAGIAIEGVQPQLPTLNGVTVAYNTATTGAGGIQSSFSAASIQGSIFTGNRGANNALDNCTFNGTVTDRGGNVDNLNDCGFTNPASRTSTNAELATTLDGSQPPALALPKTSPAVDLADCDGRALDQRGVARPQGLRCDAGAYEYMEPVVDPPPNPTPTPTPPVVTPTPTATPVATPVVNRTIVVGPARGTVKVKVPGSNRFQTLDATKGIPVGSTVDTRKGRVTLTSIPKAGAPPETATFYDGLFKVTQSRGITNLTLTEQLARCPRKGRASAAAKKKSRKLWGDGKGSFRTTGRYSAATVRGTKWLVQDSCAGTLTRVTQGSVTVRHRNRSIVVRAGKRYLARPR